MSLRTGTRYSNNQRGIVRDRSHEVRLYRRKKDKIKKEMTKHQNNLRT